MQLISSKTNWALGSSVSLGLRLSLSLSLCLFALFSTSAFAQTVTINRAPTIDTTLNDYPTVARADYVFACMAANGQSRQKLEQCSCSIDLIATILPYKDYVDAETILSVGLIGGEKSAIFNHSPVLKEVVATMRRAQAEAEFRCF